MRLEEPRPSLGARFGRGDLSEALLERVRSLAPRALMAAALLLAGAVAGLAAGRSLATRAAHRTGACIALNMAAALGYLDADQQRHVRHALATALNPDVDLFAGGAEAREACGAPGEGLVNAAARP